MPLINHSVQALRTISGYPVNIAATSTFATQTCGAGYVRISPTVNCFVKIGLAATTAATTGICGYLAAGVVEFRRVLVGDTIHAISATGGSGILTVEEAVD